MRQRNWKSLTMVVAATIVFGFMQAASATEPKKEKAAKPDEKSAQAAESPKSAAAAPLAAKLNSKLVVPHKLAAKTFVPFKLTDLKDPKTGQAPAATATLTLKNGKQVEAQKYLASINDMEKKLNAWGYSLRGPAEKVAISEVDFGKEKLAEQAKLKLPLVKGDARAQSLLTSPKVLEQEHAAAVKALKAEAKTTAKTAAKAGAKTSKTAEIVRGPGVGNGATGIGVLQGLKPFTFTKSFDEPIGSTSTFGADVNTSLTFTDNGTSATLSGSGRATGSILGISKDLVVATADISAPQTGNLTANVKVTVLGDDIVVLNESQAASYSKTGTFSRSLPNSLQVQVNVPVGPFSVVLIAGVQGSISMPYFVGLTPLSAQGWMIPKVNASVYAQAALGLEYADTGFIAGVEVNLTLINNTLILAGGAGQGTDSTGTFVNYWIVSEDQLNALSGNLSVFVAGELVGYEEKLFSTTVFNFGGIVKEFTPISGGAKVYLAKTGPVNADAKAQAEKPAKTTATTTAKTKS